jgi:hypothetical protein
MAMDADMKTLGKMNTSQSTKLERERSEKKQACSGYS